MSIDSQRLPNFRDCGVQGPRFEKLARVSDTCQESTVLLNVWQLGVRSRGDGLPFRDNLALRVFECSPVHLKASRQRGYGDTHFEIAVRPSARRALKRLDRFARFLAK